MTPVPVTVALLATVKPCLDPPDVDVPRAQVVDASRQRDMIVLGAATATAAARAHLNAAGVDARLQGRARGHAIARAELP